MVLDWLENGFPIRLRNSQPPFRQLNRKLSEEHRNFITVHIQELLALGAIEQTTTPPMCVSPIAVVPKKNGKLRMILNLKRLNQNVIAPRFRYENLDTLQGNLHPGDWCSSLDLKNGFFHLLVHRDSRTYLGFQFEGNFYQYRVLPFGLSVSPWAFTKAMREALKHIRTTMECRATTYVDDWLLIAASQRQSAEIAERVCELFRKLQLNVNMEKSTIIPT